MDNLEVLEGIAYVNLDGHVITANESFAKITGYGKLIIRHMPVDSLMEDSTKIFEVVSAGRPFWRRKHPIMKSNGDKLPVLLNISSILDNDGATIGYIMRIIPNS